MKVPQTSSPDIHTVDIRNTGLLDPDAEGSAAGDAAKAGKRERRSLYTFRKPEKEDGAAMHELVEKTGVLDVNSAYSYLMLGEYFSDTCVVAERGGRIVGFVSGFIPPERPDTVFVWQVGVANSEKGRGLAKRLIRQLLQSEVCADVHYLESTVTPSNVPSTRLFRSIARELHTSCVIDSGFHESLFPDKGDHESERLFRIGPF
ncbi:diaminobutyrate acetyltransferase [Ferruginivarius sediminum]|uniref:L-2,4-diaminobutyric acid acetyltransferase n=1 Tax=Ferruginivarius sediminum TaxID=2661937 RepID=A0A369TGG6_9PROT|nr:diaminobutyrate acetyltransferase [Ferruginivarius sediminum]RDD63704.1 diaminobutyrate acetyltransferase [Ferruginivarius sediminum]